MKSYAIYYKDNIYAETITFINDDKKFIEEYLLRRIAKYNENTKQEYHIDLSDCREL